MGHLSLGRRPALSFWLRLSLSLSTGLGLWVRLCGSITLIASGWLGVPFWTRFSLRTPFQHRPKSASKLIWHICCL